MGQNPILEPDHRDPSHGHLAFDDLVLGFLQLYRDQKRASPNTLEAYGHALRLFKSHIVAVNDNLDLSALMSLKQSEFRSWLGYLRTKDPPLVGRSIGLHLSAIRAFYHYLDRQFGLNNPAISLVKTPRLTPSLPRPLNEDQALGLMAEVQSDQDQEPWERARDYAVLMLLYGGGLRISEALSLSISDLPLSTSLRIVGKGQKMRLVPLLPPCAVRLRPMSWYNHFSLPPMMPYFGRVVVGL